MYSLERVSEIHRTNRFGKFRQILYKTTGGKIHRALIFGNLNTQNLLVRLHSACFDGEVLGCTDCDCGIQLEAAMKLISLTGNGLVIYLDQEGRGLGVEGKSKTIELEQNSNLDTVDAYQHYGLKPDLRDYNDAINILLDLNIRSVTLISNNPRKIQAVEDSSIHLEKIMHLDLEVHDDAIPELIAKRDKLGHLIHLCNDPNKSNSSTVAFYSVSDK